MAITVSYVLRVKIQEFNGCQPTIWHFMTLERAGVIERLLQKSLVTIDVKIWPLFDRDRAASPMSWGVVFMGHLFSFLFSRKPNLSLNKAFDLYEKLLFFFFLFYTADLIFCFVSLWDAVKCAISKTIKPFIVFIRLGGFPSDLRQAWLCFVSWACKWFWVYSDHWRKIFI